MKLLRVMSVQSNVFKSTGPRYFTSTVSALAAAMDVARTRPTKAGAHRKLVRRLSALLITAAPTLVLGIFVLSNAAVFWHDQWNGLVKPTRETDFQVVPQPSYSKACDRDAPVLGDRLALAANSAVSSNRHRCRQDRKIGKGGHPLRLYRG
jgi:hypothetical protein